MMRMMMSMMLLSLLMSVQVFVVCKDKTTLSTLFLLGCLFGGGGGFLMGLEMSFEKLLLHWFLTHRTFDWST